MDARTGATPYVLGLRQMLAAERTPLARFDLGSLSVEVLQGSDSLWAILQRPGKGGLALRAAFLGSEFDCNSLPPGEGEVFCAALDSPLGRHLVSFLADPGIERLRVVVRFTPAVTLAVPFAPRDIYPIDQHCDPLGASGQVEAAQRGLNAGLVYFHVDEPRFGSVLYFQNLTALNDYFRATETKPDGAVGGDWPELGYLIPASLPEGKPLPAGVEVTLSDAILVLREGTPADERQSGLRFLEMLGEVYPLLDRPRTVWRDWIGRSEKTLHDLDTAPEATIRQYGHRYAHPYTGAEYPDVMVQASLVRAIHDWGRWCGTPHPLEAELKAGLPKFFDAELGTLRRYLPNVGSDKDKDAVDSWYLYHPLLNLAAMARDGDEAARDLFLKSIDFGIKAAHHFKYRWPIQYTVTDFSVIVPTANDGRGQTDVGGIYAWVMLEALSLTGEERFLAEAGAAIDAAEGLKFNINYQANLTAWGASACLRLWRLTGNARYRDQSYVYLASFLHNCEIWESEIKLAAHYHNFLGATCLQDAPYMAIYECFESFEAMQAYLEEGGADLPRAVRLLVAEYCKYAIDRAWSYYPDALPTEAISPKQRDGNGHVDRNLSFPVEDLYADGQPAGQVGQEIYGAGAAFTFATRANHDLPDVPFRLFSDYFVDELAVDGRAASLRLHGTETSDAILRLMPRGEAAMPRVTLTAGCDGSIAPDHAGEDYIQFHAPAGRRLTLAWTA